MISTASASKEFELSPQQINYFEDFGFLVLRGLFSDEIQTICDAFDEVFATKPTFPLPKGDELHYIAQPGFEGDTRLIIGGFIELHPGLAWLRDDPRVEAIARGLIGEESRYDGSDGNIMNCNVSWHPDTYLSPLEFKHIKLMFYLDPLNASNGALRVIPGTCHWNETYAKRLRDNLPLDSVREAYGVAPEDIPSFALELEPGDLIVDNFRTLHGSFNGGLGRRLFTMNYGEIRPPGAPTGEPV